MTNKVTISIDAEVMRRIDKFTKERGMHRSGFLARCALEHIERHEDRKRTIEAAPTAEEKAALMEGIKNA